MGIPGAKPNLTAYGTDASHKAEIATDFLPLPVEAADASNLPVEFRPNEEELSPDGVVIWNVIVPDLVEAKVFRESDTILLAELCESLSMARSFRKQIHKLQPEYDRHMDEFFETSNPESLEVAESFAGLLKKSRTGYRESMQTAMSIAGEFGISPVARMRLGLLKLQGNSLLGALNDL